MSPTVWATKMFLWLFQPSPLVTDNQDRVIMTCLACMSFGIIFMIVFGFGVVIAEKLWETHLAIFCSIPPLFSAFLILYFTSRSNLVNFSKLFFCFTSTTWFWFVYITLASQRVVAAHGTLPSTEDAILLWLGILPLCISSRTPRERKMFFCVDAFVVIGTWIVTGLYSRKLFQVQNEMVFPVSYYIIVRIVIHLRSGADVRTADTLARHEAAEQRAMFFLSLNHDIRTHLNGIMGCLDVVRTAMVESASSKKVQRVDQSSAWPSLAHQMIPTCWQSCLSLLGLVNDILDLHKMQTSQFSIVPSAVDLRATLSHTLNTVEHTARSKSLALSCNIDDALPTWVYLDQRRFEQVVLNLLSNAIKFTTVGGVELKISLLDPAVSNELGDGAHHDIERGNIPAVTSSANGVDNDTARLRAGSCMVIEVRDTGPGISAHDAETLFEPFKQLENGKKFGASGAGLGLAICKQIVSASGGTISMGPVPASYRLAESSSGWQREQQEKQDDVGDDISPFNDGNHPTVSPGPGCLVKFTLPLIEVPAPVAQAAAKSSIHGLGMNIQKMAPAETTAAPQPSQDPEPMAARASLPVSQATSSKSQVAPGIPSNEWIGISVGEMGAMQSGSSYGRRPLDDSDSNVVGRGSDHNNSHDGPFRVLLAEDNVINAKILKHMFRSFGDVADLFHVLDGKEAVDVFSQDLKASLKGGTRPYDCVFLDMNMPVMGGIEACGRIQQVIKHQSTELGRQVRKVPMIAFTASEASVMGPECLSSGFDEFVTKPITIENLKLVLRRHGMRSS